LGNDNIEAALEGVASGTIYASMSEEASDDDSVDVAGT
jgi:hypothetical protein